MLCYITTKYYKNRSTFERVITINKRVNFFETQCTNTRWNFSDYAALHVYTVLGSFLIIILIEQFLSSKPQIKGIYITDF